MTLSKISAILDGQRKMLEHQRQTNSLLESLKEEKTKKKKEEKREEGSEVQQAEHAEVKTDIKDTKSERKLDEQSDKETLQGNTKHGNKPT